MTHITPIHPGEHLAEMLTELGISQYRLARAIGVPPRRINEIVHGRRSVTAHTALRVGRALGTTPEFWLNLQRMYDLDLARASADVSSIEPPPKGHQQGQDHWHHPPAGRAGVEHAPAARRQAIGKDNAVLEPEPYPERDADDKPLSS